MQTLSFDRKQSSRNAGATFRASQLMGLALVIAALHLIASYSFLLFHTLVESLRIVVLSGIFILAWHGRRWSGNNFLLILGIGALFTAGFELLHTLSYKGLGLFPEHDANLPTQLWIAFRYLESASFLFAALSIRQQHRPATLLGSYAVLSAALFASIFGGHFPDCYIEGSGLTAFKIYSEYLIIALFVTALAVLLRRQQQLQPELLKLIGLSILFATLTEFAFTRYIGVFDFANELGHLLLLVSTYFLYRAVLVTSLVAPFELLFRNLKDNELKLEATIAERTLSLRESQTLNSTFIENSPSLIFLTDRDSRYTLVNQAFEQLAGHSRDQILGRTAADLWPPETSTQLERSKRQAMNAGKPIRTIERIGDGLQTRFFESIRFPLFDHHGALAGSGGIATDITEQQLAEQRYGLIIHTSLDAFVLIDRAARILEVNEACSTLSGYSEVELLQRSIIDLEYQMNETEVLATLDRVEQDGAARFETVLQHRDGSLRDVEVSIKCLNHIVEPHFFCFIRDITERRRSAARIEYLAHHDLLTGLPNKHLFERGFEKLSRQAREHGDRFALAYLDLDNFKNINDTLGHAIGDRLLGRIARLLEDMLDARDLLCRPGGDEFLLLHGGFDDDAAAGSFAEKLLAALAEPIEIDGHQLNNTVSIGLALFPRDGGDFETLFKKADTAVFQAKAAGRNAFRFFDEAMHAAELERIELLAALRGAISRDELQLHYQPQIELDSGKLIGVEALLRWRQGGGQMIPPGRFIPIAEDSGLIVPIGSWVLHEACRQAAAWQALGLPPFVTAVNLSAAQFRHPGLLDTVREALRCSGLPPACLELELTESLLIGDSEAALETIRQLKQLGLQLSIDDFGTGYSSLAYLQRFAVDKLKIDQSFIRAMDQDTDSSSLVRTIIQMADNLGLVTIAEGVEHASQAAQLQTMGCNEAQGYHFARPLPAAELQAWVDARFASKHSTP
ncbi:MAG: EAL domain-containing protein [Thauera sp.]|jgi:diguanylate cyclase (GGDEF)-like protein/PAS domain S-box-containing protein|nr:EAL domain-containing protein [Thauera sp.]